MSTASCVIYVRYYLDVSSIDPHEHSVSLYDLQHKLAVLDMSIFAFQYKKHVGCNNVGPRDSVVSFDASSMRILCYSDTHVGRHIAT